MKRNEGRKHTTNRGDRGVADWCCLCLRCIAIQRRWLHSSGLDSQPRNTYTHIYHSFFVFSVFFFMFLISVSGWYEYVRYADGWLMFARAYSHNTHTHTHSPAISYVWPFVIRCYMLSSMVRVYYRADSMHMCFVCIVYMLVQHYCTSLKPPLDIFLQDVLLTLFWIAWNTKPTACGLVEHAWCLEAWQAVGEEWKLRKIQRTHTCRMHGGARTQNAANS